MTPLLEVCCGNWQSVCAAADAGARRIELCSALALGGLTPSLSLYHRVRETYPNLAIHVLIRPREGNFIYSSAEAEVIERDIRLFAEAGADGIVCGALTAEGRIDTVINRFVRAAGQRSFTFHRAFDHLPDPAANLPMLLELGCTHLLTSGGAPTACEGIPVIRELTRQAEGRITVIPAAGINAENAAKILLETGASELHASCAVRINSTRQGPAIGTDDDGTVLITDPDRVRALIHATLELSSGANPAEGGYGADF